MRARHSSTALCWSPRAPAAADTAAPELGELRQLLTVGIKAVTGLRNYVPFIVHSIHRRASRPGVALGHADRLLRLRTLYMSDDARDLVAIVGERYKEDIARFGYVFPENSSAPTMRT